MSELIERDLTELYCRLSEGVFYRDYDEDGRLMGVLRKHINSLAAPEPSEEIGK